MKKLWFKRKTFGWGWVPVTWEGWVVVLAYIAAIMILARNNALVNATDTAGPDSGSNALVSLAIPVIFLTTVLILICYKKGEQPKWMWGNEKSDK